MASKRNEQQIAAANPEHSAWVSAHAGAGKTFVLIDRLVRLLLSGVPSDRILCITFTKAAAGEMSERLYQRLSEWALCDENTLREELTALENTPPSKEKIETARGLFLALLEGQSKNHIQTIHAFCQSVLKRFPIEANVYPNFKTIDEYQGNALMKEAQLKVLQEDSPANLAALKVITHNIDFSVFEKIFAEITKNRKKIEAMMTNYPDKLASLAQLWSVDKTQSPEALRARILTERPDYMKNLSPAPDLEGYVDLFFTKAGSPRKNVKDKQGLKEQERIGTLIEEANLTQSIQFTEAFLQITENFLKKFARAKEQKGLLDYDDLIYKTHSLFQTRAAGQWVLYRLDGGIDHILIDEAQDTNPEQWQLIEKLSEEFFAGVSYKENPCSLFVVGDAKQSIFGFQGAAADGFARQRKNFAARAKQVSQPFLAIPLDVSFRAAPQLLAFIDGVLGSLTLSESEAEIPPHKAFRKNTPGKVEVWPLFETQEDETAPANERLALAVAEQIDALLQKGELEAKDILILLRRRNKFFNLLIATLREKGLAVAGSDRLVLAKELVIQDLLSLAKWVLLPQDDLSLAEVLKSPLCHVSEAALMAVALGRGEHSLWQALQARANTHPEVVAFLTTCLQRADFVSVFDFFSHVLEADNRRADFVSLLGDGIHDPLDAFLNLALDYEKTHTSSLQGFIEWFSSTQAQIKRDMERGNEIHLMTIHSAKGLESKAVFYIDIPVSSPKDYFQPIGDVPFFSLSALKTNRLEEYKAAVKDFNRLEEARLLYVALTRARDELYVCGYKNKGNPAPMWHETIADYQKPLAPSFNNKRKTAVAAAVTTAGTIGASAPPPSFLINKISATKKMKRQLSPSSLVPPQAVVFSPLDPTWQENQQSPAALRGTILHEALRYGSKMSRSALLALLERKFDHQECAALADHARALINNQHFAEIFSPAPSIQILDEAPLQALFAQTEQATTLSGKIDRLLLDPAKKQASIIDYKSDAEPPPTRDAMPVSYQLQLASYSLMIGKIYPDWDIRAGLLWTALPRLDWLDKKTLEKQKKVIISKVGQQAPNL